MVFVRDSNMYMEETHPLHKKSKLCHFQRSSDEKTVKERKMCRGDTVYVEEGRVTVEEADWIRNLFKGTTDKGKVNSYTGKVS